MSPGPRYTVEARPRTRPDKFKPYPCGDHHLLYDARQAARAAGCPEGSLPFPGISEPKPPLTAADFIGCLLVPRSLAALAGELPSDAAAAAARGSGSTADAIARTQRRLKASLEQATTKSKLNDPGGALQAMFRAAELEALLAQLQPATPRAEESAELESWMEADDLVEEVAGTVRDAAHLPPVGHPQVERSRSASDAPLPFLPCRLRGLWRPTGNCTQLRRRARCGGQGGGLAALQQGPAGAAPSAQQ